MFLMSLFSHLELVKDNRSTINQYHNLVDVLFLIICAVTSGCEGWQDIEVYGESKIDWLKNFVLSIMAYRHDTALLEYFERSILTHYS